MGETAAWDTAAGDPLGATGMNDSRDNGLHPLLSPYQRQQQALVDFLYHRSLTGYLVTLLIGALPTVLIWRAENSPWPWAWFAVLSLIVFLNVLLYLGYDRRRSAGDVDHAAWRQRFVVGAAATGLVIGLGAAAAYPVVGPDLRLIMLLLLLGLAGGAIQYLGPWLAAYVSYVVALMAPVTLLLLASGSSVELIVALIYLFMMAAYSVGVRYANRLLLQALYYRFENERLAIDLEGSVDTLSNTNRALQELSTTDDLTGMINRRGFRQRFTLEWRVHMREGLPLSLIMLDVDFFKNYNDAYGHMAGDTTLIRIGQVLESCLKRPGDLAARFGGEEFILLLPRTDIGGAQEVADNVRRVLEEKHIEHAHSPIASHVTVSMGVVCAVPRQGIERGQLIEYADQALYEAKERGRNRYQLRELEKPGEPGA